MIKNTSVIGDVVAIFLSNICLIHCLVLPILTVTIPSFLSIYFEEDAFHLWMLVFVLPISLSTLMMGCRRHKQSSILSVGVAGLLGLIWVALFGHDFLAEAGEKLLTVVGSSLIAFAHVLNYRACRRVDCACSFSDESGAATVK